MIGKKIYKNKLDSKEYRDIALWCNANNACIEDKGEYYEVVEIKPYQPTLEEQLNALEQKYNMPRVIREGILGNPTAYSAFNVARAREVEELAEQIRKVKEGNN